MNELLVVYLVGSAFVFIFASLFAAATASDRRRAVIPEDSPVPSWSARVALLCWAWPVMVLALAFWGLRWLWETAR